jgi:hypothetical protein
MCSTSFKLPVCSVCRDNMEGPLDLKKICKGNTGDLPGWITNEFLPTRNFPDQIVDQSFLRAINASVHRRKNPRNVNFTNSNYKDVPTSFHPVALISFARANKLDLHLYGFARSLDENKEGVVYPIYNSERGTYDAKVFLLIHGRQFYPIRNPLNILRPELDARPDRACLKCGSSFSSSTLRNKHYDICLMDK